MPRPLALLGDRHMGFSVDKPVDDIFEGIKAILDGLWDYGVVIADDLPFPLNDYPIFQTRQRFLQSEGHPISATILPIGDIDRYNLKQPRLRAAKKYNFKERLSEAPVSWDFYGNWLVEAYRRFDDLKNEVPQAQHIFLASVWLCTPRSRSYVSLPAFHPLIITLQVADNDFGVIEGWLKVMNEVGLMFLDEKLTYGIKRYIGYKLAQWDVEWLTTQRQTFFTALDELYDILTPKQVLTPRTPVIGGFWI